MPALLSCTVAPERCLAPTASTPIRCWGVDRPGLRGRAVAGRYASHMPWNSVARLCGRCCRQDSIRGRSDLRHVRAERVARAETSQRFATICELECTER